MNFGQKYIAIIVLVFLISSAFAQPSIDSLKNVLYKLKPKSSEYIEFNKSSLSLKPYYHFPGMGLRIANKFGQNLLYRPNVRDNIGLQVNLKGVSVATSLQLPSKASKNQKYGNTQFSNFQTNIATRSVGFELKYLNFKGLYSPDLYLKYPEVYYSRRDIKLQSLGFSTFYLPSSKVSLAAALTQSEKQLQSAGSFTVSLSGRLLTLKCDSVLVPQSQLSYFPLVSHIEGGFFGSISAKPGYTYTYVYQDYFATGIFCIGPSLNLITNSLYTKKKRDVFLNAAFSSIYKLAIGMNKERYFGNIIWELETNAYPIKSEKLRVANQSIKIGFGLKFN